VCACALALRTRPLQVPALAADVLTPEYCSLTEDEEKGGVQAVNAWFGPAGTVTPLHTDPHHNLLAQVRDGLKNTTLAILIVSWNWRRKRK